MFLIGEVCGASLKASSNNEPTEVSRCLVVNALKLWGYEKRKENRKEAKDKSLDPRTET